MNDAAVVVALVNLVGWAAFFGISLYFLTRERHISVLLTTAISALLLVASAYALAQIPASSVTQQEEPTLIATPTEPWPTGTPEPSGWLDYYDALRVTDEQLRHDLDALAATVTAWQSYPTVIPTATPAPILCKHCAYESECGSGYRCYLCTTDKVARCVPRDSPNGGCTTCINQGR